MPPGALEIGWSELRRTQAGLNLHDDIEVNAHHLVVTDSTFPVLLVNARSVLLTQSTLNAHTEDPSRWQYPGYSMPDMGQGYGGRETRPTGGQISAPSAEPRRGTRSGGAARPRTDPLLTWLTPFCFDG